MIEGVYMMCIYLNALEIPQCFECFEIRSKCLSVSSRLINNLHLLVTIIR